MHVIFVLTLVVSLLSPVCAAEPPKEFGAPVLVTIGRNPWATVLGAESASFVLYDNRVVLFIGKNGGDAQRLRARLSEEAYKSLVESALDLEALEAAASHINLTSWHDQPTTELIYRRPDGKLRRMMVYGAFDKEGKPGGVSAPSASGRRGVLDAKVPAAVLKALQTASGFASDEARPWKPELIEVMIWDYHYAPDEDLPWPKKWPGLTDAKTVKRGGDYNSHSLFLQSAEEDELISFIKSRREKQAVAIDGKKWSISFRRPLPREGEWQKLPYRE